MVECIGTSAIILTRQEVEWAPLWVWLLFTELAPRPVQSISCNIFVCLSVSVSGRFSETFDLC